MRLEDLGLIGNCQIAALVARSGQIVWCCLPRFDSEPVFGRLLDEDGGQFAVGPASGVPGEQRYLPNTNVLETRFETADGRFRILDFAPRFMQNNRMFRPTQLLRIIEPLEGTPLIGVHCEPRLGWSRRVPVAVQGSHHIRYEGYAAPLRLTTDIPLSYLGGQSFALSQRRHLILSWGAEVDESIPLLAERFLAETSRYWQRWVKHSNIPAHYQQEVIRSALALKLHCYEDTGAIAAALTTSIPESPDRSGRNWDYRYCWLRDSYYVLGALRLLGHFEEREQFIHYLLNIAANEPELDLRPLYRIDGGRDLDEQTLPHWAGFNGLGPVRIGNAAAQHRQHDVFGEMILALAPIYLDDRFIDDRSVATLDLLERLARKAAAVAGTPDAGIWEYRKAWEPQTFSSLMCWAGIDRVARIAQRHRPLHAGEFREMADRLRAQILPQAWSAQRNSFVGAYGGQELDAALLQLVPLRFLPPDDPRLVSTVQAIADGLTHGGWLYRYRDDDGLGVPTVAFVICTFWLIEALAMTGSSAQAKELMARVHEALSPLGLLSEDYDTQRQRMWGNFPQAYSHVGLIHAAFAAAPRWSELL